ncbi:SMAD/FHA domain-containing protein [Auricularia subglabra TFB-10046 SS5]|nr:SMAD/FHA domain-containing protein [Auricularia subglabra TFB-10046 SS5]
MAEDPMEDVVATQPDEASQAQSANGHLWGALIPTSQTLKRLDLWRGQNVYTIGRHQNCDFRLASPKISNVHCEITYRGGEEGGDGKEVTVEDKSTNGTFINGIKIGKGKHMLLEQGNELTLGISIEGAVEEYRYMYRHLGNPNPPSSIFDQYQLSSDDP